MTRFVAIAIALISASASAQDQAQVRVCETPNEQIREAIRFELSARGMSVVACERDAEATLRVVFESQLQGGFVEVRVGSRPMLSRLPGPLDTLDDRAVAVTAAALLDSALAGEVAQDPEGQDVDSPQTPAATDSPEAMASESTTGDAEAPPGETTEPEVDAPQRQVVLTYLDPRHRFSILAGFENIGPRPSFVAALEYLGLPSPRGGLGTQLSVGGNTDTIEAKLDLRGTRIWHRGRWSPEVGGHLFAVLHVADGAEMGAGGGVHGGATWYGLPHFGVHLGATIDAQYRRAIQGSGSAFRVTAIAWAGVRFGP